MFLETLVVGDLQVNCYILADEETKEALVIDPGDEAHKIWKVIEKSNFQLKNILLTHGHADHIGALTELKSKTSSTVLIHKNDAEMLSDASLNFSSLYGFPITTVPADDFLSENQKIYCGKIILEVLHTPGHSAGGICLKGEGFVFTGDTLFTGSVGRTDFPGSSFRQLFESIANKLLVLPPETVIFPGHGPSSTIGEEKQSNPFLQFSKAF